MCILLFLLFFNGNPAPRQTKPSPSAPPTLIVQIVDPAWDPVPGAHVTVKSLDGNVRSKSQSVDTDNQGCARFFVPADSDYTIEVKSPGFKNGALKLLHLPKSSAAFPTAYVQLKLDLAGSPVTVY
jgi:hypothetical protein